MVTYTSEMLQELGKINYFENCRRLMLSGVHHLDERAQVEAKDYLYDPNTGDVEKSYPKCKFYLRHFIIHIMKKTDFIPAFKCFFCTSCLVTKKLPPAGYGNVGEDPDDQ